MKKLVIAGGALLTLVLLAFAVQAISHRVWERHVWSCYEALGSGTTPLPDHFVVPPPCRAAEIGVAGLGTLNGQMLLVFRPPATMWLSYALRTSDYDAYSIVVRNRESALRAEIHHGSD